MRKLSMIGLVTLLFCLECPQTSWALSWSSSLAYYSNMGFPQINNFGKTTLSNMTVSQINNSGEATLNQVTVQGLTQICGLCQIHDSQLNALRVYGKTEIDNSTIQGETCINGMTYIDNTQLNTLQAEGQTHISKSNVKDKAEIEGNLNSIKTVFEELVIIMGHVQAKETSFCKSVTIIGHIKAKQTCFADKITAISEKIDLHDVIAQELYIKKNDQESIGEILGKNISFDVDKKVKSTTVSLSGKTVVKGTITFESGDGEVLLKGKAIIEGGVIGGVVKRL